jgi:hypothetical protein
MSLPRSQVTIVPAWFGVSGEELRGILGDVLSGVGAQPTERDERGLTMAWRMGGHQVRCLRREARVIRNQRLNILVSERTMSSRRHSTEVRAWLARTKATMGGRPIPPGYGNVLPFCRDQTVEILGASPPV